MHGHRKEKDLFSEKTHQASQKVFAFFRSCTTRKKANMAYSVSDDATYAVLYTVLFVFGLIAIASADFFKCCLPTKINNWFTLAGNSEESVGKNANRRADFFLSARNSATASTIALSYFASGMGAWVYYGTPEMAATGAISWIGMIGYAFASSAPAWVVFAIGPTIKNKCHKESFNFTDYGRQRYGRTMQFVIAGFSVFYMFIYLVAEYTSISNIYMSLSGNPAYDTMVVAISISVITILYTSIGGVPASLITDRFQAYMVGLLVLLLLFAVSVNPANQITAAEFAAVSHATTDGVMAFVTLFIAILSAELFNLGTWQRVWAAKDEREMKRGFVGGSILIFALMMFFGIMGMVAYAKDPVAYDTYEKLPFLSFFDILEPLAPGWHVVTLVLTTALAASSVDTLQNSLMATFSTDLMVLKRRFGVPPKWIARLLIVGLNIPAIILAARNYFIIPLFLVADLVCACAVLPVFLGLMEKDKGIIAAPTELGALLGTICAIFTVVVIGVVVNAEGGLFDYFWLDNDAICSLCGSKTMLTFIITPLSGGFFCLFFSKLDVLVRGENARKPIFYFLGEEAMAAPEEEESVAESVAESVTIKEDKIDEEIADA